VNNLAETAIKSYWPSGNRCDTCKKYFHNLKEIFTSHVGFKDLCKNCTVNNDIFHNKNINTFPSKIQFDKRRVI